jgi:hypothetical protein
MSWHEKLDRLAVEFLEETDAILGAVEDKAERMRYASEIAAVERQLCNAIYRRWHIVFDDLARHESQ